MSYYQIKIQPVFALLKDATFRHISIVTGHFSVSGCLTAFKSNGYRIEAFFIRRAIKISLVETFRRRNIGILRTQTDQVTA